MIDCHICFLSLSLVFSEVAVLGESDLITLCMCASCFHISYPRFPTPQSRFRLLGSVTRASMVSGSLINSSGGLRRLITTRTSPSPLTSYLPPSSLTLTVLELIVYCLRILASVLLRTLDVEQDCPLPAGFTCAPTHAYAYMMLSLDHGKVDQQLNDFNIAQLQLQFV